MSGVSVERVERVGPINALGPGVSNRFVVDPANLGRQLPFVLLVEDFIGEGSGFHQHPHRGLETVTFILSGQLRHADHLGATGLLGAGDVQWMTAGRGIEHGGEPVGGRVHGLQLWLALPKHLRNSAPGTREQRMSDALSRSWEGGSLTTYGIAPQAREPWSQWPLRVMDLHLEAGARGSIPVQAGESAFLYLLDGAARVAGREVAKGEIVWLANSVDDGEADIDAMSAARVIAYASPSFDEPIIARGAFVGGDREEIEAAFADARSGRLLAP